MKTKEEIIQIINEHKNDLVRLHVKSLSLFGSVARGDSQSDSDIDFLVEFEGGSTLNKYVDLTEYLESLFGQPIDLITKQAIRPEIQNNIFNETVNVA